MIYKQRNTFLLPTSKWKRRSTPLPVNVCQRTSTSVNLYLTLNLYLVNILLKQRRPQFLFLKIVYLCLIHNIFTLIFKIQIVTATFAYTIFSFLSKNAFVALFLIKSVLKYYKNNIAVKPLTSGNVFL